MSRIFQVMGLMVALAMSGNAAELVSIKAVPDGKATNVLTVIKAEKAEMIYHVWIYTGKTPAGEVYVYDSATKTGKSADQADLDWLKERNIEGARMIVKLTVTPSPAFHTRSQKTMDPKQVNLWKVEVYDETSKKPIGGIGFNDTPPVD
jgi:hypothetical protein